MTICIINRFQLEERKIKENNIYIVCIRCLRKTPTIKHYNTRAVDN